MRPEAVQELFRILTRALRLAAQAREALGPERDAVDHALALLEEARAWLPAPTGKAFKPPRLRGSTPEYLLFRAVVELRAAKQWVGKRARVHTVPHGFLRVNQLIDAAADRLREAWLGYLYAHGLPSHLKPWRTFSWYGGTLLGFLVAVSYGFLENLVGRGNWPFSGLEVLLMGGWGSFCLFVLRCLVYPRGSPARPAIVPRGAILRRLLPVALALVALPALGFVFRPDFFWLFGRLGLIALGMVLTSLVQAVRLLFLPEETRILVLPGLFVAFLPRLPSWPVDRVFLGP
ncbi:MAG: hypothetical protein ABDI20_01810 [Candidatus Bipolaricaulaceae bacterium]